MKSDVPAVELRGLKKEFGKVRAVGPIDIVIYKGEFFSLLGPSGCGKTTTLRLIAGLEAPSEGDLVLGGQLMTNVPTHCRGIGMVFQNYALFPHRTVRENVAFGLRMRKVARGEIAERVERTLKRVDLSGLGERYPAQLSGGQQQRVALARAIVYEPEVILFDEPLSNLDAKLREQMRSEIRRLTSALNLTAVYVTHDQAEALALSDRIAVLNKGHVVQVGHPSEIYESPKSRFVADFIGAANLIRAVVQRRAGGWVAVMPANIELELSSGRTNAITNGTEQTLLIRPERIQVHENEPRAANAFVGVVTEIAYLGSYARYVVKVNNQLPLTIVSDRIIRNCAAGHELWVSIAGEVITVIDEPAADVLR
ncbi:ABC transporter ATP-binding protein [Pseudorhodoplanes sp.]|uniref:ABC transporter ATP-binding protein n=1 Tax=Pseudorhodoplanes sp. TaxID=1934341 RepID=UPI003D0EE470